MLQIVKTKNKTLSDEKVYRRKADEVNAWLTEDSLEYQKMIDHLNSPEVIKELKKIEKGPFIKMKTFFDSFGAKNS